MPNEIDAEPQSLVEIEQQRLPMILEAFGVGKPTDVVFLSNGLANHVFSVQTEQGAYVVKVLRSLTPVLLENEIAIQQQLQQHNIGTNTYLTLPSGTPLFDENGIQAVVSKKIAGKHIEHLSLPFCTSMGETLATFHRAVTTIPHENKGWLSREKVEEITGTVTGKTQKSDIEVNAVALITEGQTILSSDLPAGIIHGDFYDSNVLVDEHDESKIVAVLDFEESEQNVYMIDMARTIISICHDETGTKLIPSRIDGFINGYELIRKLERVEKESLSSALKYVGGAAALWLAAPGYTTYAEEYIQRVQSI